MSTCAHTGISSSSRPVADRKGTLGRRFYPEGSVEGDFCLAATDPAGSWVSR